jgi:hypothetical protein
LPLQGQFQAPCSSDARIPNTGSTARCHRRGSTCTAANAQEPISRKAPTGRLSHANKQQVALPRAHIDVGLQDASPCSSLGLTNEGSAVTAQPDSNATGSRHPTRHQPERCAARHGQCRTVRDRLGVKGFWVSRACLREAQLIYQATVTAARRRRKPHHWDVRVQEPGPRAGSWSEAWWDLHSPTSQQSASTAIL